MYCDTPQAHRQTGICMWWPLLLYSMGCLPRAVYSCLNSEAGLQRNVGAHYRISSSSNGMLDSHLDLRPAMEAPICIPGREHQSETLYGRLQSICCLGKADGMARLALCDSYSIHRFLGHVTKSNACLGASLLI